MARADAGHGRRVAGLTDAQRLYRDHEHLAAIVAAGWTRTGNVDRDDVEQLARIGVWVAATTYRPGGSSFPAWAIAKARWQVIDGLRVMDVLPRSARDGLTAYWRAVNATAQRLGRAPDAAALTAAGVDVVAAQRAMAVAYPAHPDTFPDPATADVADEVCDDDDARRLVALVGTLPPRLSVILELRYWQAMRWADIADVLGLSEASLFNAHRRALAVLRAALSPP